jgi:glycine hydroxymethyltransferase
MKEKEMETIAGFIARALNNVGNEAVLKSIGDDVRELCRKFPIYPDRLRGKNR